MKLNLSKIPDDLKEEAKEAVGELIVDRIQEYLDRGNSPVAKQGRFKRLSKDYANKFKGGDTTPDLLLDGDLRDSITYEIHSEGVKVGVFNDEPEIDRLKASGHNKGNSSNKTKRQFIPLPEGKFKRPIMTDVKNLLASFKEAEFSPAQRTDALSDIFGEVQTDALSDIFGEVQTDALSDIFGEDQLDSLLRGILGES